MNKPASMATSNTTPRCAKDQTRFTQLCTFINAGAGWLHCSLLLFRMCGSAARIPQAGNEGKHHACARCTRECARLPKRGYAKDVVAGQFGECLKTRKVGGRDARPTVKFLCFQPDRWRSRLACEGFETASIRPSIDPNTPWSLPLGWGAALWRRRERDGRFGPHLVMAACESVSGDRGDHGLYEGNSSRMLNPFVAEVRG